MPTGFKSNRSKFLKQITEDEAKQVANVIKVENSDGLYTEAASLLDKYESRDCSKNKFLIRLSYIQFCMKYVPTNTKPKPEDLKSTITHRDRKGWQIDDEMDLLVTHDFEISEDHYSLPKYIKLNYVGIGEPEYMRKRSRRVIRIHKFNSTKNPHEYRFAQLQMYRPFIMEEELQPECFENCDMLFDERSEHNGMRKIDNVRTILMPYLESVECGTERALEIVDSSIGNVLDSALEQENEDCLEIGADDHPNFLFKDPTDITDEPLISTRYKPMELYDDKTMISMSRSLDHDQRMVLEIGVDFAKSVIKSRKRKHVVTSQVLLVVQGGAGSGKSTVIDILSQQIEKILRQSGDNPEHPYCIKAAFTGTAAANIKGQTLHSAFSFSFGNEFHSLNDKARDERRTELVNLQAVIIDELSFIKADMLYLLDLRLREVKQQADKLFGGVSVFLFGDILQLRPVIHI